MERCKRRGINIFYHRRIITGEMSFGTHIILCRHGNAHIPKTIGFCHVVFYAFGFAMTAVFIL
jgi:hypothetical protein